MAQSFGCAIKGVFDCSKIKSCGIRSRQDEQRVESLNFAPDKREAITSQGILLPSRRETNSDRNMTYKNIMRRLGCKEKTCGDTLYLLLHRDDSLKTADAGSAI